MIGRVQTLTLPDVTDGMAGRDPVGRAWSRRYEPAAQRARRAADDLVPGESLAPGPGECGPVAGTEQPVSWSLVAAVNELTWPDGRPDVLRAVSDAWCRAGDELQRRAGAPAVSSAHRTRCQTLARAHRSLATACAGLADDLDRVHADIAAALALHGLDSRPRSASAASPPGAISYASPTGPVELATGWRIAAAAGTVRIALADFALAAAAQARALTLVGELCADVSRLAGSPRTPASPPLAHTA